MSLISTDTVVFPSFGAEFDKKQEGEILYYGVQGCCFFIQFNVPFKIISLIETSQSVGGTKR